MNKVFVFEIILLGLVVLGALSGLIGWERAGQVFLAIGILDLVLSIAAWRGWPVLRGDISNNAPLSKRDLGEAAPGPSSMNQERPSTGFVVKVAVLGSFAIGIGVVLLVFFA